MRSDNSRKNLLSGISLTVVMTLLGFVTRKLFVDTIGIEYLGLNGLLTNILALVSLVEGGFGMSVVYNLYKPLAEDDQPRIIALIRFYRKVYRYVTLGVLLLGLSVYPFLNTFIKDGDSLRYVSVVFFIFLFNSLLPYLTAPKWSLINADQKQYRLTVINFAYQIGLNFAKLAILYYTGNYILYLIVESVFGLGLAAAVVRRVNRLYPYIATRSAYKIDEPTRKGIVRNSKALFLHSIGGYLMHSTDNIVISSFVSISVVGIYSNYTLITGYVKGLADQILNSFSESVGHLVATETPKRIYEVFRTVFLLNFLVVSIPAIVLANITNPFIAWWLGAEYLLQPVTLGIILLNFLIIGLRSSAMTFKIKSGIFVQDRFSPLMQGAINLVLSLSLVGIWGITGVLAATAVSVLAVGFWQFPRLIYKYTFKQPLRQYFKQYAIYTGVGIVAWASSYLLCRLVGCTVALSSASSASSPSPTAIVCGAVISTIVPAAVFYAALCWTQEMKNLIFLYAKPMITKLFKH